jgi:hypothetical protein
MSEVRMNGDADPAHAPAHGRVGASVLWCIVAALACFVVAWPAGAFNTGGGIRGGSENFCLQ